MSGDKDTVSKAHHEAVVRGLSATIRAQAGELERLLAVEADERQHCDEQCRKLDEQLREIQRLREQLRDVSRRHGLMGGLG